MSGASKSRGAVLTEQHVAWRERMQAITAEMRKRREHSEDVWGVSIGHFKDGKFSTAKESGK